MAVVLDELHAARIEGEGEGIEEQQLAAKFTVEGVARQSRGEEVQRRQDNKQADRKPGRVEVEKAFEQRAQCGLHAGLRVGFRARRPRGPRPDCARGSCEARGPCDTSRASVQSSP